MDSIFNTSRIDGPFSTSYANMQASKASSEADRATSNVRHLTERLDRLLLVSMSLWELLKERTDLTEDDLLAKVREVDLRDGRADGKISKTVKKCPKCDRTMSPRLQKCLYCGAEDLDKQAFESAV